MVLGRHPYFDVVPRILAEIVLNLGNWRHSSVILDPSLRLFKLIMCNTILKTPNSIITKSMSYMYIANFAILQNSQQHNNKISRNIANFVFIKV